MPSQSVIACRKDALTIRPSSRGQKRLALGTSVTEDSKETTLEYFRRDMHAQSSDGPRQSLLKTWLAIHNAWFGFEGEGDGAPRPFPLSVFSLHAVGAVLKQGDYRSAANYYSRAKEEHIAHGHLAVRKVTASVT